MKTDYKPGDKVVVIKSVAPVAGIGREVGKILTVEKLSHDINDRNRWQVYFEEAFGLDFEHIRPLTLLEKELLE